MLRAVDSRLWGSGMHGELSKGNAAQNQEIPLQGSVHNTTAFLLRLFFVFFSWM